MKAAMLLQKVGRYGAVGLVAATVHAGILLLLNPVDRPQPGQPDRFSGGLFPEIPGEFEEHHSSLGMLRLPLTSNSYGVVRRAIVD